MDCSRPYSAKHCLLFVFCGKMALNSEVHPSVPTINEEDGELL